MIYLRLHISIICSFLLILFFYQSSFAQTNSSSNIDQLKIQLNETKSDSARINLLLLLAQKTPRKDSTLRLNYARQALTISEKIMWIQGRIKANLILGTFCDDCQNYTEAIRHNQVGAILSASINDSNSQAQAYDAIAHLYHNTNQFDSSLQYFEMALRNTTNVRNQVGLRANIGIVYNDLSDYVNSLESYLKSLKLNKNILSVGDAHHDDSTTHAGLLISLGDIYLELAQFDNALENYSASLKLNKALNESIFEMMANKGIADVHVRRNDFLSAITYYDYALKNCRSRKQEASLLNDLGNVYLSLNNLPKALEFTNKSLELAKANSYENARSKASITLGKIYTKQKNFKGAINYLQNAIDLSYKIGVIANQRDAWLAISDTYNQMQQPSKALVAFKEYITLRDSIYNIEKIKQMMRSDMQFKFDSRQLEDSLKQSIILQRQKVYTLSGFAGLGLALMLAFFILIGYRRQKKSNTVIREANAIIQKEKLVSENLLLNILPQDVADELKANGKVKAKLFQNVTVLFTDFVNFTSTSQRLSPQALIEELDECFKAFDEITVKYKIEKIKTVGDAYLAICGLPLEDEHHALNIVNAAIEMRDFMLQRKASLNEGSFEIRLGVHSGSAIAGIVGFKKFAYDIWGDSVNTAARMEQSSEAGKINISEATYELVKNEVHCIFRGEVEAKNKGKMKMYFVTDKI